MPLNFFLIIHFVLTSHAFNDSKLKDIKMKICVVIGIALWNTWEGFKPGAFSPVGGPECRYKEKNSCEGVHSKEFPKLGAGFTFCCEVVLRKSPCDKV